MDMKNAIFFEEKLEYNEESSVGYRFVDPLAEVNDCEEQNGWNVNRPEDQNPKHCKIVVENGVRTYLCTLCPYNCNQVSNFRRHVETHTGDRPFHCPKCPYSARRNDSLKDHLATHLGEKNFFCEMCDYRTYRQEKLKSHLQTHNSEKKFVCPMCAFSTTKKSYLTVHLARHTRRSAICCELCGFRTVSKLDLQKHVREHGGKQPTNTETHLNDQVVSRVGEDKFGCRLCSYETNYRYRLLKHIGQHKLGENVLEHDERKRFVCPKCKFLSKSQSTFTMHMRSHGIYS